MAQLMIQNGAIQGSRLTGLPGQVTRTESAALTGQFEHMISGSKVIFNKKK